MISPLSTIPLLAGLLCVALHFIALHMFPRWKLLDFPERYGLIRRRLPYPSGILAVIAFLAVFFFMSAHDMKDIGLMAGVTMLGIISFIDDRTQLSPRVRLLLQILIALLLFAAGVRIYTITNPLLTGGFLKLDTWNVVAPFFGSLPVWSGVFTVLWLLLTINALNWFDGIPGQVTTLGTIGFLTIGLLSLSARVNQPALALIAFVLAAIAFACLLFDFPPPKVVLGDTGSMFFGLMLGSLTIFAGGKVATAFLVLGVPLIDSFFVVIRRIAHGKSPLKGSSAGEHLHHRLLAKGWTPRQVIILTASIGLLFGGTALFLSSFQKLLAAVFLFCIMLALSIYSAPARKNAPAA
ncbi:MAG TPA: MraY family glycosyltransferase [Candidatus Peribacteraceae bacterium]|nr:MraY family glycosyltransferase [Candidatus Peribacteraceae bacterium]